MWNNVTCKLDILSHIALLKMSTRHFHLHETFVWDWIFIFSLTVSRNKSSVGQLLSKNIFIYIFYDRWL